MSDKIMDIEDVRAVINEIVAEQPDQVNPYVMNDTLGHTVCVYQDAKGARRCIAGEFAHRLGKPVPGHEIRDSVTGLGGWDETISTYEHPWDLTHAAAQYLAEVQIAADGDGVPFESIEEAEEGMPTWSKAIEIAEAHWTARSTWHAF